MAREIACRGSQAMISSRTPKIRIDCIGTQIEPIEEIGPPGYLPSL
jgi:hypothetical protein